MADSLDAALTPPKPETFKPSELTNLASLTDGRPPGYYKSVYPLNCWIHIVAEFIYLIAVELVCVGLLFKVAIYAVRRQDSGFFFDLLGPYPGSASIATVRMKLRAPSPQRGSRVSRRSPPPLGQHFRPKLSTRLAASRHWLATSSSSRVGTLRFSAMFRSG
jgi:hypothetical protein